MAKKEQKRVASKNTMRFDPVKAEYGIKLEIVDDFDNYYGTFKVSLLDKNSVFYRNEIKRFDRLYKDDKRAKGENFDIFFFVMTALHGWEGIVDEDGNEIPFSKDAAYDYFCSLEDVWVVDELSIQATRVANFKHDPVARKEEAAGN